MATKKPSDRQLLAAAADPAVFRRLLLIDADGSAVPLAKALNGNQWQHDDFVATDPAWKRVVGLESDGPRIAWVERPRGHSKSGDAAVSISWALFASRNKLSGILAAGDAEQAALVKDAVAQLVRLNPWLADFLKVAAGRILNPHTGSEAVVATSDAPTSFGWLPSFVCADEVSMWAKPDLWWSILSAIEKKQSAFLLAIQNAGYVETWQYEFREKVRTDPTCYFHSLEGPCATWIPPEAYERQRRLLPAIEFNRVWGNQWGAGTGTALEPHVIDSALRRGLPLMAGADPKWSFAAGLDLSVSRDWSCLAVVGKGDGGRYRLAAYWQWKPSPGRKVDQQQVEATILAAHKAFRIKRLVCDAFQAEGLVGRMMAAGIHAEAVQQSGLRLVEQATMLCAEFNSFNVDIPDDEMMLRQLRRARLERRPYGVRLVTDRTSADGHFDLLNAFCIGLVAAAPLPNDAATNWGGVVVPREQPLRTVWHNQQFDHLREGRPVKYHY